MHKPSKRRLWYVVEWAHYRPCLKFSLDSDYLTVHKSVKTRWINLHFSLFGYHIYVSFSQRGCKSETFRSEVVPLLCEYKILVDLESTQQWQIPILFLIRIHTFVPLVLHLLSYGTTPNDVRTFYLGISGYPLKLHKHMGLTTLNLWYSECQRGISR